MTSVDLLQHTARPHGCARVVLITDPHLVLPRIAHVGPAMSDSGRVLCIAPVGRTASASIPPAVAPTDPVDFSDPESQRVLRAAARAVACELGREAAREYFAELIRTSKVS